MDVAQIVATTAVTALTSGVVGAIVATLVSMAKDKRRGINDGEKAMREGMKLLLMDKVKYLTQQAVNEGEITIEQRAFIVSMADAAHALGANGEMTACANIVAELQTKHSM